MEKLTAQQRASKKQAEKRKGQPALNACRVSPEEFAQINAVIAHGPYTSKKQAYIAAFKALAKELGIHDGIYK